MRITTARLVLLTMALLLASPGWAWAAPQFPSAPTAVVCGVDGREPPLHGAGWRRDRQSAGVVPRPG